MCLCSQSSDIEVTFFRDLSSEPPVETAVEQVGPAQPNAHSTTNGVEPPEVTGNPDTPLLEAEAFEQRRNSAMEALRDLDYLIANNSLQLERPEVRQLVEEVGEQFKIAIERADDAAPRAARTTRGGQ